MIESRGWHSEDRDQSDMIFHKSPDQMKYETDDSCLGYLSEILLKVDGILFTVTPDGHIQNVYGMIKIILDTVSSFISGEMDKFIDYSLDDGIETIYELLHAENSDNVRQFLKEVNTTRNNNNYLNHRIKFRKDTH